jgi:hypothetical protein
MFFYDVMATWRLNYNKPGVNNLSYRLFETMLLLGRIDKYLNEIITLKKKNMRPIKSKIFGIINNTVGFTVNLNIRRMRRNIQINAKPKT